MAEGCRSTPFVADSGLLKCYIKVSARKRPRPSCGLPARRGRPAQGWECAAGLSDLGLKEHPDRIIHLRIRARMIEERSVKRKKDGGGNTLHDRHQSNGSREHRDMMQAWTRGQAQCGAAAPTLIAFLSKSIFNQVPIVAATCQND